MNALHNLVAQGKVLYLVRCFIPFLDGRLHSQRTTGNFRYTSMGRVQSESIREGSRKDSVLNLSGKMECVGALV